MKDRFGYILFRVAASIIGLLPEAVIRNLGVWAGGVASKRRTTDRVLPTSHMRRVIGTEASETELAEAVDGMYRSYGRYWAETFWFRPRRRRSILRRVQRVNFGPVYKAQAANRGIVFAVTHVGNWEIAGLIAEDMGLNLMAVAEDLPNERITQWFVDVRAKFGIDIVLTSDKKLRSKMIRRLKDGGALALLADRDVTGGGIPTRFFGEETSLPAGPAALAELTDSVLLPVTVYFNAGAGHRIVVGDPVETPETSTRAERIKLGTQRVTDALEWMIREEPSQWHLFQPNWPSDNLDGARGET